MIEINLLPDGRKKKETHFKKIDLSKLSLNSVPVLSLAAGVFAVLITLQVILFFIGIYGKGVLTSLDKQYKEELPKSKEAAALKAQVDAVNKKIKAIDELMVKRFGWAKKLNDLSDSVTAGIWLTELSYNEKLTERPVPSGASAPKAKAAAGPSKPAVEKVVLKYLIISGFASTIGEEGTALIGKFIKGLKDNDSFYSDFSDIELGAIKRDRLEDQEVMSFKLTCLFKETK